MFLQNNCSYQQQTLPGKFTSVFEKNFTIDVLLRKKLQKAKKIYNADADANVNADADP